MYTQEEHIQFGQNLAGKIQDIDPVIAAAHPNRAVALTRVMQRQQGPVTLSRSRFCEDRLEEAVWQGVEQ